MSITLTPTLIKRGVLIVLLAGLMFAAGFAARDADAQPGSAGFVACVNNYTGVIRQSDVAPESILGVAEPIPSEEVEYCRSYEEAWLLPLAFPVFEEPSRPLDR